MFKAEPKLKLGKKTSSGYKYSAKVDFSRDLFSQIDQVMREKEVKDELEKHVSKIRGEINKFKQKKEKNIKYYYSVGKNLLFIDDENFKNIAPGSIYRIIGDEIPGIFPYLKENTNIRKHLEIMYGLGHLEENYLRKASWDQWYEVMKFKELYKNKKLLKRILEECKKGLSGISLRNKIKELRRKLIEG